MAKLHATATNYKQIHLKDTILHLIQTTIGYFLMLIAMTFHYALFSAAMLGMAAGFYWFNRVEKPDEEEGDEEQGSLCKTKFANKQQISTDACGC